MKRILTHGIIVTMDTTRQVIDDGFLAMAGDTITEVGPMSGLAAFLASHADRFSSEDLHDVNRAIVMPGMINTHTHLGMIPFRGLGDDCKDRLRVFLLPMEREAMDEALAAASTRYAIAESLLAGVTTVFDMYYFAGTTADIMEETGIRGFAGETVMEEPTCDFASPDEAITYGQKEMERYANNPRVKVTLAPHGTTTASAQHIQTIKQLDTQYCVPFSLHTAEMDYEMDYFKSEHSGTPVTFLHKLDVLDERTLLAHCIHMDTRDLDLLEQQKTSAAHCIASNTKAGKGVSPILSMQQHAIHIGLGTDGPASGNTLDLFTQMRMCENFHKTVNHDRNALPAINVVEMATIGGAAALGIQQLTGSLEPGKAADIAVLETDSPNMFPVYDPYSAIVYSANASNVAETYVNGECLVEAGKLTKMDLKELRNQLYSEMNRTKFRELRQLL